ncbi:hypothetical protein HBI39_176470 [Parastagonospora nodorum]|nr:hypothetical protein HBI79_057470 [Parastagonospora nodorum]KAH6293457.1 hypothetical protein HBI39_176470 [Parastagonospora nodorum]
MEQKKSVPGSLQAFLKDGVEAAECSICTEPFNNQHVVVQIKECGHHFDKNCLEKWLKQKDTTGTCPTCRGVLFKKKRRNPRSQATIAPVIQPSLPPQAPRAITFNEYYGNPENVQQSSRDGFLSKAWSFRALFGPTHMVLQAYNADNDPSRASNSAERLMLTPYIELLRRALNSNNAAPLHCPVVGLARTLSQLFEFCTTTTNFVPTEGMWRAIMLYQTELDDLTPIFTWPTLCEAAWTLHDPEDLLRRGGQQWQTLYLFLWLIPVYRAQRLSSSTAFTIDELRDMLKALNIGYPIAPSDAVDTQTRVFLSAAVHVLTVSETSTRYNQTERNRRLQGCNTSVTQLKIDVEGIWRQGLAKGGADVAAGYPEHWWTGV